MKSVQVEIFGQTYSLKVAKDPAYLQKLASFLDSRMKEVQKGTGTSDVYRVAILTALNLADELHRLRSQHDTLRRTTEVSLDRLLDLTADVT